MCNMYVFSFHEVVFKINDTNYWQNINLNTKFNNITTFIKKNMKYKM